MRRKTIEGVMRNFLATFTSRNTDYEGYSPFGMLVPDLGEMEIDLLSPHPSIGSSSPVEAVVQIAADKFQEQCEKAGLSALALSEARLLLRKDPNPTTLLVNETHRVCHEISFALHVSSGFGKTNHLATSLWIAPHDPSLEIQNMRSRKHLQ